MINTKSSEDMCKRTRNGDGMMYDKIHTRNTAQYVHLLLHIPLRSLKHESFQIQNIYSIFPNTILFCINCINLTSSIVSFYTVPYIRSGINVREIFIHWNNEKRFRWKWVKKNLLSELHPPFLFQNVKAAFVLVTVSSSGKRGTNGQGTEGTHHKQIVWEYTSA